MNKINIINGILAASRNELTGHTGNVTVHITQEECERWNAGLVQDGPSGELTKGEVQAVVDKRLYDAGIMIKRISPKAVDIPAEGGRVEFAIDTNVPLRAIRLFVDGCHGFSGINSVLFFQVVTSCFRMFYSSLKSHKTFI